MAGQVIGIASSIVTKSEGFEGLGFVVTSNTASRLLLEQPPFWFGLDGIVLEDELAMAFNLPQPIGFLVQQVADNSPAARLRLRPEGIKSQIGSNEMLLGGDVILELVGIEVTEDCYQKIQSQLNHMKPGDIIEWRSTNERRNKHGCSTRCQPQSTRLPASGWCGRRGARNGRISTDED